MQCKETCHQFGSSHGPAVPRTPRASPPATLAAGSGLAPFWPLLFWPVGGRRWASGTPNRPHSPPSRSGCPKGGSEFKYYPRPDRLWGHPKGPLGAPEPHLSGPILPCINPERGNISFWPPDARAPQRAKTKGAKMAPNLNQRRGWPGDMPGGPWEPRGPWDEPN